MDSIDRDGKVIDIYAFRMITFFHKLYRTVDIDRRNTELKKMKKLIESGVKKKIILNCIEYTFRLHTCLSQSRIRLHLASHVNVFEHGISFE